MCESCGCGLNHPKAQAPMKMEINANVMAGNNAWADKNKALFSQKNIFAVNLISSPGSGKTTLLQAMASHFGEKMGVIVGDIQTRRDAERIESAGSPAYQIETGGACHLDAHSVHHALNHLALNGLKLLVIENVGNLVCPAGYYLGEGIKIALLSTPEGDDKVLKYPGIFHRISALVISKIDLLPHLEFDVDKAVQESRSLNNEIVCFQISAKDGTGLPLFYQYLEGQFHSQKRI